MPCGKLNMDVASETIDNLTLLLTQIVEFTGRRRQILTGNILHHRREGFMQREIKMEEFTRCMTMAVSEHLRSKRLLFRTAAIYVPPRRQFEADPVMMTRLLLSTERPAIPPDPGRNPDKPVNGADAQQLLMPNAAVCVPTEKTANYLFFSF